MKIIEVTASKGHLDTVLGIADQQEVRDHRLGAEDADGRQVVRLLVADEQTQKVLDALEGYLSSDPEARILVIPVEAALPRPSIGEEEASRRAARAMAISRQALYDDTEKGARLDSTFLVLVFLSTIVAAIGLIEDNVAVVIGAMVIAPLLGPNIALALGTALGDTALMWRSLKTNLAGVSMTLVLSIGIALLLPINIKSHELLARTDVGLDSVALALASGAAAALSLTTGLSSVLVGVMVAVALLPPAATFGLMLGSGEYAMATGAGLLLAVNVVCVNFAAKLVFLVKGIHPRTWWEKKKARQSLITYLVMWAVSLLILVGLIYLRRSVLAEL
ncbi:MAG: TIGR00341 family protein [Sulfuricaulis sp.]|nr:TIGR00341 family protein [Sulfuricaulis sp.]